MKNKIPTLGQKISQLIAKNSYPSLLAFHKAIQEFAGEDAIAYSSLHNVVNDVKEPEERTLYQISYVLKMKISDLREGTTSQPPESGPSTGYYPYNETSILYTLYNNLPFRSQLIKMKGRVGHTSEEREIIPGAKCFKLVYICRGIVQLVINRKDTGIDRRELRKGDVYCFNASEPHHFENKKVQYGEIHVTTFTKPFGLKPSQKS